jgi:hypothetical protein
VCEKKKKKNHEEKKKKKKKNVTKNRLEKSKYLSLFPDFSFQKKKKKALTNNNKRFLLADAHRRDTE